MEKLTIESVQTRINNKANVKATQFVNKLLITMKDSGLLNLKEFTVSGKNDYAESMENCFMKIDSQYKDSPVWKLYEVKYKQFVEEETTEFMRKVNELVDKADELLSLTENQ